MIWGVTILYTDDANWVIVERKNELEMDAVEAIVAKVTISIPVSFLLLTGEMLVDWLVGWL